MYRVLGDLQQAKECYDRALAIFHFDVALSYNNLGTLHHDLGDLQQAKECHDRALAIRLKRLGPEHIDVGAMQNNLMIVQREREIRSTSTTSHRVCCMIF